MTINLEKDIKALSDWVIVEPTPVDSKTSSGIIIPNSVKDKSQEGIVVSVGCGKNGEQINLKVGDKVIFNKYGVTEIKVHDNLLFAMRFSDIYLVVA